MRTPGRIARTQLLQALQLPFDLVDVDGHGVQPDHLDGAGRLVDVAARLPERSRIGRRRPERGERSSPRASAWPISP